MSEAQHRQSEQIMNSTFLTYIRRSNGDPTARAVRLTPAVVAALGG
jgi:hypothetical protein